MIVWSPAGGVSGSESPVGLNLLKQYNKPAISQLLSTFSRFHKSVFPPSELASAQHQLQWWLVSDHPLKRCSSCSFLSKAWKRRSSVSTTEPASLSRPWSHHTTWDIPSFTMVTSPSRGDSFSAHLAGRFWVRSYLCIALYSTSSNEQRECPLWGLWWALHGWDGWRK